MMSVIILMWLAGKAIFRWWLPEYDFSLYAAIPVLFMVFTIVLAVLISVWDRKVRTGAMPRQKVVVWFMTFKMVRLLVSAAAILCYMKFIGENKGAFLVTFAIFYFVFLGLETFVINRFDRKHSQLTVDN